jgi:hypothetical protein
MERKLRDLLHVAKGRRVPKAVTVTALIGISFDERDRIKPSVRSWIQTRWPLVDLVMRRHDCDALLRDHGLPSFRKSACVFCPFHTDAFWDDLQRNYPEEFARAVAFDHALRGPKTPGTTSASLRGIPYLHESLMPLDEVTFNVEKSFDGFGNECSGHCGV